MKERFERETTEAEYIEREALRTKLDYELARWIDRAYYYTDDISGIVAMKEAIYDVITAPAADVQEVRHGYWHADAETGCLICSECGHFTDEIIGDLIKADEETENFSHIPKLIHRSMAPFYCSKCGARMDGKEPK